MAHKFKASAGEPAKRPHLINLSHAEMIILFNWHLKEARRVRKLVAGSVLSSASPKGKAASEALVIASANIKGHVRRANHLANRMLKEEAK